MTIESSSPVMTSTLQPDLESKRVFLFSSNPHDCGRVPREVSAQLIGTRVASGTVPAHFQHVSTTLPAGPTTKAASAMPGLPARRACMFWFPDSQAPGPRGPHRVAGVFNLLTFGFLCFLMLARAAMRTSYLFHRRD